MKFWILLCQKSISLCLNTLKLQFCIYLLELNKVQSFLSSLAPWLGTLFQTHLGVLGQAGILRYTLGLLFSGRFQCICWIVTRSWDQEHSCFTPNWKNLNKREFVYCPREAYFRNYLKWITGQSFRYVIHYVRSCITAKYSYYRWMFGKLYHTYNYLHVITVYMPSWVLRKQCMPFYVPQYL